MKKAKFPGFKKCMEMMHSRDGDESESGFGWLEARAGEFVNELIEEFDRKENAGLRFWILELIGAARSPNALPFLVAQLRSNDWRARMWAIIGLKNLNSKEARTILWEARSIELESKAETDRLRIQLDAPHSWWLD